MVPSAQAATTLRMGYSSLMRGARSAGTSTARNGPARTAISATGSPACSRGEPISICAPISRRVSSSPILAGLTPTLGITRSEPGTMSAATSGKAAALGSPGTVSVQGSSSG